MNPGIVELVRVTTTDGHRLDGALQTPPGNTPHPALDACLVLHGVGGNFYGSRLLESLAVRFGEWGLAVLRVNTRGHDSISICWGSTGPIRQGAVYESVDQCRHDIDAWVQFLRDRGWSRIGLVGHSLGAIKAIFSQATTPNPEIRAVVACSAPRLSYSAFMNSESQPRFFESLSNAREQVRAGRADSIIQSTFPFPMPITAAGFLDKYGPEERYNILRHVDQVACRMLITYGQLELERGGVAFAGMPEAVLAHQRPDQDLAVITVPGADHSYTGVYDALASGIASWLARGTA